MADEELIRHIAGGGSFDVVAGLRALARKLAGPLPAGQSKQAPAATLDACADDATESVPAEGAGRKRKPAAEG